MGETAQKRLIPKAELRKIKRTVAALRKKGHEVWTDEEVERLGYTLDILVPAVSLAVPKQRQEADWDCGLACAKMALLTLGCPPAECEISVLRKRLVSSEVWSIDLAYLLAEHGVSCELVTATASVGTATQKCDFYSSTLEEDAVRVACLFAHAEREDVCVRESTLSEAELWNTLRTENVMIIALVDHRLLYRTSSVQAKPGSFAGHYVLLVGLDDASCGVLIKDPARPEEAAVVSSERLELARHAAGTDEDLLIVPLYEEPPPCAPPPGERPKVARVLAEAKARSESAST